MKATIQFYRALVFTQLKKNKLSYSACNVQKRQKPIFIDIIYSDVFAIDNKCKMTQLFVKTKSQIVDIYDIHTIKFF